jgi:hypothetical protein
MHVTVTVNRMLRQYLSFVRHPHSGFFGSLKGSNRQHVIACKNKQSADPPSLSAAAVAPFACRLLGTPFIQDCLPVTFILQ